MACLLFGSNTQFWQTARGTFWLHSRQMRAKDVKMQQKMLTTFFTTRNSADTAMGLLLTCKTVQEHGGKVSMEPTPGESSLLQLPSHCDGPQQLAQTEAQQKSGHEPPARHFQ
jgi:hypothetical protein